VSTEKTKQCRPAPDREGIILKSLKAIPVLRPEWRNGRYLP